METIDREPGNGRPGTAQQWGKWALAIRNREAAVTPGLYVSGRQNLGSGGLKTAGGCCCGGRGRGCTTNPVQMAGPFWGERHLPYFLPTQSLSATYPWGVLPLSLSGEGRSATWGCPLAAAAPLGSSSWGWSHGATRGPDPDPWDGRSDAGPAEHWAARQEQRDPNRVRLTWLS